MKLIKKLLKDTHGYTLVELLLAITIFAIGIGPIYQIILSSTNVQNAAEETYEATLHAQALLQDVNKQIEKDVGEEYKVSRGLSGEAIKPWLNWDAGTVYSLSRFLEEDEVFSTQFNTKYNLKNYLYEVYIWPMEGGEPVEKPISMATYNILDATSEYMDKSPFEYIKEAEMESDNEKRFKKYFESNDSLIWVGLGETKPIAIGEIIYNANKTLKIISKGIVITNAGEATIETAEIEESKIPHQGLELIYASQDEGSTHELIVKEVLSLEKEKVVQLSIDLTTFPDDISPKIIRIENKTEATVLISVYNEQSDNKELADIKIYPIQENKDGNIVLEDRPKLQPSKNFIIGIIVRDANNIAFGDENKILSKIVDVYSFDYNKQ